MYKTVEILNQFHQKINILSEYNNWEFVVFFFCVVVAVEAKTKQQPSKCTKMQTAFTAQK